MQGYQNEFAFVMALNNKRKSELNPLLDDLIYFLFGNIGDDIIIKSWRNKHPQKTDIFVKVNGVMKGISINYGSRNSVHTESISTFIEFLKELNASEEIIDIFLKYHYGDGSTNGTGKKRISAEECKLLYSDDIIKLNQFVNDEMIIRKAVDRFVLRGINSDYAIDVIVYGTPNDFLWLSRENIVHMILMKKDKWMSPIHFSSLVCQPLNRCLNFNKKYENCRKYVQIKWYSLFDDIIYYMNDYVVSKCGRK